MARIEAMLAEQPGGNDLLAYVPPTAVSGEAQPTAVRAAVASTFAAALKLARESKATLDGGTSFASVTISLTRSEPSGAASPVQRLSRLPCINRSFSPARPEWNKVPPRDAVRRVGSRTHVR